MNRRSVLRKGAVTTLAGAGILGASGVAAAAEYELTIENNGNQLGSVRFDVEKVKSSASIHHQEGEKVSWTYDGDVVQFTGQLGAGETSVYAVEGYSKPYNGNSSDYIDVDPEP